MNISEIYNAIKSYLAGFLTFIVCFAAATVFLWSEYKAVQADKEGVSTQLLSLKDAEIELQKEKTLLQLELKDREFELSRKEVQIERTKTELENRVIELTSSLSNKEEVTSDAIKIKERELSMLIDEYEEKVKKVSELHSDYSHEAQKAKAEELILSAMNDFAALGVNMGRPDWCDQEYMSRYYQGKALIDQVSALNNKYEISDEYTWFVRRNSRSVMFASDGECKVNKSSNSDAARSTDS